MLSQQSSASGVRINSAGLCDPARSLEHHKLSEAAHLENRTRCVQGELALCSNFVASGFSLVTNDVCQIEVCLGRNVLGAKS